MENFRQLKKEFENELTDNILNYWIRKVYDPRRGTFYGLIGPDEKPDPAAPLSAVLITRILWTFSAAHRLFPTAIYQKMADEAFRILTTHFWDNENGGVYWEVSSGGEAVDTSKQFYAQSFALYGLAEYFRTFGNQQARQLAISLFYLLEKYAFDPVNGGYGEAVSANWQKPVRKFITPAGEKMNKSMNTHLHLLEAYTNLLRIWQEDDLKKQIGGLLDIFSNQIINPENHHFHLFFDNNWSVQSTGVSYGHDIEGSWLLYEAAEVLDDEQTLRQLKPVLLKMALAAGQEALHPAGGLFYESDGAHRNRDFHWWAQAEAVVGFFNAWQLSGDQQFLNWTEKSWHFIRQHQIDRQHGEWFSQVNADLTVAPAPKVSGWKCPYHNGRMCLEMAMRLAKELKN